MKLMKWLCVTVALAGTLIAQGRGPKQVSAQTWGQLRTAAPAIFGEVGQNARGSRVVRPVAWFITIPLASLGSNLSDALQKYRTPLTGHNASTVNTGSVEIASSLLDYKGGTDAATAAKKSLESIRVAAYRVPALPTDEAEARNLFEFAKSLGAMTIVVDGAPPASLALVDRMAGESELRVAFSAPSEYRALLKAVEGTSPRIGASIDVAKWGLNAKSTDALAALKDRVVGMRLRGTVDSSFLQALDNAGVRPTFVVVEPSKAGDAVVEISKSLDALETALLPVAGKRVAQLARDTPIQNPTQLTDEQRAAVAAAIPSSAPAKPKKAHRVLVMDYQVAYGGHASRAYANLSMELWGNKLGAFTPVFTNDVENLKYPKIREYDAIFFNNTVGQVFVDPEIRASLLRFVREGGGLAGYHGLAAAALDWPEFGDMLGARLFSGRGDPRLRGKLPPATVDSNSQTATLKVDDPGSPITAGFPNKEFEWKEEYYFLERPAYSRDRLHILLSIENSKTDMTQCSACGENQDVGVAWIRNYGKGRVFFTSLGHWPAFYQDANMSRFMLAGIQFVLGDLEADATPSTKLRSSAGR
ncbi:MAG: ThuA domain-containing protein [Candidatus Korobacteraceae bacterium]